MLYKIKRLLTALNVGYKVPLSLEEKFQRLETDPAWTTIELPIDGRLHAVEEVLVIRLEDGTYRLANSPGLVEGLAADDIIRLDAQNPNGYTLVRRGENVCIYVYCPYEERDRILHGLTQTLGRIGGRLDGTMGQTGLCFTISVRAGFSVIEGALQRVVGDEWTYSNVHDPETGDPLNWWLHPNALRQ